MKYRIVAGMAALALYAAAEPPPIGRLFTTPAERDSLDRQRETGGPGGAAPVQMAPAPAPELPPVQAAPALAPPPAPIVVSGIVTRSDGKSTVWINGVPQDDQPVATVDGVAPAVTVVLPSGQQATLKAGQGVDVTTGAVGDALQR